MPSGQHRWSGGLVAISPNTPREAAYPAADGNRVDEGALDVNRVALAVALAGIALGAPTAGADPLNPRDPDYCGNSADILFCTEHRSPYPNAGESAYLADIRGRFPPGTEARRLAAGRAVCLELPRHPVGLIVEQIGAYLQIPRELAGDVVGSARANICPQVEAAG